MIGLYSKLSGDLSGALDKFEKSTQEKVLFSGVATMASVIYDEARANVPVKEGTLKDAIYRVYSKDKSTDSKKTYHVSWNKTKAPHGHLIEFGTSRAPAYPFIRPAFDHVGRAIEVGKERMAQAMDEVTS